MITALIADASVPAWDRGLVQSINDVTLGLAPDHTTTWSFGVMNDDGEVYRRIVAESSAECVALVGLLRSSVQAGEVGWPACNAEAAVRQSVGRQADRLRRTKSSMRCRSCSSYAARPLSSASVTGRSAQLCR